MNNDMIWAVAVGSEQFSDAIQRIAFSFEYKWPMAAAGEKTPKYLKAAYLFFNPIDKNITWGDDLEYIKKERIPLVANIIEAMNLFKNPPVRELSMFGGSVKIFRDGSVTFNTAGSINFTPDEFDILLKQRETFTISKFLKT